MEFKQVKELIKLISESNISEFKMEEGDLKISVRTKHYSDAKSAPSTTHTQQILPVQTAVQPMTQHFAPPVASPSTRETALDGQEDNDGSATASAEEENHVYVRSPIVGTFYRSPAPDKDPFVKPGDQISTGDIVCIVEAMKLFNEIESEVSGKIVKILVDDASPIEFDQALFIVDPQG